jgi:hypothetical protein
VDLPFDFWHLAFANLMQRCAPPNFEVQSEVRLSLEPQRADMLLLRRTSIGQAGEIGNEPPNEKARKSVVLPTL